MSRFVYSALYPYCLYALYIVGKNVDNLIFRDNYNCKNRDVYWDKLDYTDELENE